MGIKAVLRSRIDKWEDGSFLDEMVEGLTKPYINSFWVRSRAVSNKRNPTVQRFEQLG
jgi:hypothetical protein